MLQRGATVLSIWSGINFLLAFRILTSVVVFDANSPLLVMVFEKTEIVGPDTRIIASLNALTILYNSCSMVVSVLVWLLIRKSLLAGETWAFWVLLFVIGFIEVIHNMNSLSFAYPLHDYCWHPRLYCFFTSLKAKVLI